MASLFNDKNFPMTHKDLVEAAYRWLSKRGSCGVVFKELVAVGPGEIPDVIGFGHGNHSVLIECKTSRSDYRNDFKKPFRINGTGMGRYRLFCVPENLISIEELPAKWGLIYVDPTGKPRAIIDPMRRAYPELFTWQFEHDSASERAIMYTALRRLHLRGHTADIYTMLEEKRN